MLPTMEGMAQRYLPVRLVETVDGKHQSQQVSTMSDRREDDKRKPVAWRRDVSTHEDRINYWYYDDDYPVDDPSYEPLYLHPPEPSPEREALAIAKMYENAPCFPVSALLAERRVRSRPCTCPTCGHRAIIHAILAGEKDDE